MWRAVARALVVLSVVSFCALHTFAALAYPGGTVFDSRSVGCSFWLNYLCDLTHSPAMNGAPNPGAPLAQASMLTLSIGLGAFFWLIPWSLHMGRREGTLTRWLGVIALPGVWIATLAPPGAMGNRLHTIAVFAGASPGLAATMLAVRTSFRRRRELPMLGWAGVATFITTLADSLLYAMVRASVIGVPKALPAIQKLAVTSLLTWMVSVAVVRTKSAM